MDFLSLNDYAHNIAKDLISLEPQHFETSIDTFFYSDTVLGNPWFAIRGARHIKTLLHLDTILSVETRFVRLPQLDKLNNTVSFSYQRIYGPQFHQSYWPLSIFEHWCKSVVWDCELYLETDDPRPEHAKYYISKVVLHRVADGHWYYHLLPLVFLRPIISLMLLVIASIATFFFRHPFKNGLLEMSNAAVFETLMCIVDWMQYETSVAFARLQAWNTMAGKEAHHFLSESRTTLKDVEHHIQSNAHQLTINLKKKGSAVTQQVLQKSQDYAEYIDLSEQIAIPNEQLSRK